MGVLRDVDIGWDDLIDAFENSDPGVVYLLDRVSGEILLLPSDYEDDQFWSDVSSGGSQYLQIPGFDYDQERLMLYEFIQQVENDHLKGMLNKAYSGRTPYGKVEEILSFYPDEMEHLEMLRESFLSERVKLWLEEHDLYSPLDLLDSV